MKDTGFYNVIDYLDQRIDADEGIPNEEMNLYIGLIEWQNELFKIILDDVPHQYQDRLLKHIKPIRKGEHQ